VCLCVVCLRCFGHTHQNTDFIATNNELWRTRVASNQLGYFANKNSCDDYSNCKVIDVSLNSNDSIVDDQRLIISTEEICRLRNGETHDTNRCTYL